MPDQHTPALIIDFEATDNTPEAEATQLGWRDVFFNGLDKLASKQIDPNSNCSHFLFCKPDRPIGFGSMAVTHITPDMVEDEESHKVIAQGYLPKGEAYIIGHNVDFDIQVAANAGVDVSQYKAICTLALAREVFSDCDSHSLGALIYYLFPEAAGQYLRNAHNAGWDVTLTYWMLHKLCEKAGINDMEGLYQASEKARIPTKFNFGKHYGANIPDIAKTDAGYLAWVINTFKVDKPYLVKACQQALGQI